MEARLEITRKCLEVMVEFGQPVGIVSKSRLVLRDLDLLKKLNERGLAGVAVSITSLDAEISGKMEPRAASPRARLEVVREVAAAGLPVAVMVAPVIPGLNDREVPAILKAASEAGARQAGYVLLRLPYQIKDLFVDWLKREVPDRASRVEALIRESRDGELYKGAFFERQRGVGAHAEQIGAMFAMFRTKFGLDGAWVRARDVGPRGQTLFG